MDHDFVIVGAGIAGASVGAELAARGRTLVLERESQPGYHTTGRSAAVFAESYGPPVIRALTRASRAFLGAPPGSFGVPSLIRPLGALFVAEPGQQALLDAEAAVFAREAPAIRRIGAAEALALLPVLRQERVVGALYDPDTADLDVHALHQGLLRQLRAAGGRLRCDAEVVALQRRAGGWQLTLGPSGETLTTRVVVDAAGAWGDVVAGLAGLLPLGLQPKRRSAFVFAPPPGVDHRRWPLAIGMAESWYLKPDAGQLLASPANADPVPPHDVQPEELDIALGIDRLQQVTTLTVRRPTRTWAGLRSFVPDGGPVAGFDETAPGFFWLVGQGGYGIQTTPALGRAAAALVCGEALPDDLLAQGVSAEALAPGRLRAAPGA
ncbi:MAG: FAD-binding oxidoreductase [Burkholderiaceae bacterium]|nr:FAD-binding oxidoreductase [Burkholderiaceae bacterium]